MKLHYNTNACRLFLGRRGRRLLAVRRWRPHPLGMWGHVRAALIVTRRSIHFLQTGWRLALLETVRRSLAIRWSKRHSISGKPERTTSRIGARWRARRAKMHEPPLHVVAARVPPLSLLGPENIFYLLLKRFEFVLDFWIDLAPNRLHSLIVRRNDLFELFRLLWREQQFVLHIVHQPFHRKSGRLPEWIEGALP